MRLAMVMASQAKKELKSPSLKSMHQLKAERKASHELNADRAREKLRAAQQNASQATDSNPQDGASLAGDGLRQALPEQIISEKQPISDKQVVSRRFEKSTVLSTRLGNLDGDCMLPMRPISPKKVNSLLVELPKVLSTRAGKLEGDSVLASGPNLARQVTHRQEQPPKEASASFGRANTTRQEPIAPAQAVEVTSALQGAAQTPPAKPAVPQLRRSFFGRLRNVVTQTSTSLTRFFTAVKTRLLAFFAWMIPGNSR